jgi:Cu/Ag efflux protein CusF
MSKYLLRVAAVTGLVAVALAVATPAFAEKAEKTKSQHLTGKIESIDAKAGTITVNNKKEGSKTFALATDCKMSTAAKPTAAIADFSVGDKVVVSYTEGADGKLTCVKLGVPVPKEKK